MSWAFAESVTLHQRRRTSPDTDGNDTWTETDTSAKAALYPLESTENTDARDTVEERLRAVFKPPVGLTSTDEVTARGIRWQVDGAPGAYHSPLTRTQIETVILKKATG